MSNGTGSQQYSMDGQQPADRLNGVLPSNMSGMHMQYQGEGQTKRFGDDGGLNVNTSGSSGAFLSLSPSLDSSYPVVPGSTHSSSTTPVHSSFSAAVPINGVSGWSNASHESVRPPVRKASMTREQRKYCSAIMKQLKKHRDAMAFLNPVNPVLLNIPDYPEVIKNPMDLTTLEKKLNDVKYETVDDFIADMNLIFNNCYLYNGRDAIISVHASNLEQAFNSSMRHMPKENEKAVAEPVYTKESPKKASTSTKAKKEASKKETKLTPVTLVAPEAIGSSSAALNITDSEYSASEEKRPKRDTHAPSKEIPPGNKRKGSAKWKSDPRLRFCQTIVKEFFKKSNTEFMFPFMEAVDWVKLKIPDYPKIIRNPMDVGTIKKKLDEDKYENASQFESDVRQVLWNCFTFNPPGTPVYLMGRRMEQLFESKWSERPAPPTPLPAAPEVEVASESEVEGEEVDSSDDKIAEMERHLKTLSEQLETMKATKKKDKGDKKTVSKAVDEKPIHQEKSKAKPATKSHPKASTKLAEKKPASKKPRILYSSDEEDVLTYDQQLELSNYINDLQGEEMSKVLQIIREAMPNFGNGEQDEIELDMDLLDPKAVYRLYEFAIRGRPEKRKRTMTKKARMIYSDDEELPNTTKKSRSNKKSSKGSYIKDQDASMSSDDSSSSSDSDSDASDSDAVQVLSSPRRSNSPTAKYARGRSPPAKKSPPAPTAPPTKHVAKKQKQEPATTTNRKPKVDIAWLNQSLTSNGTMSFDVAPLDLDVAELTSKKKSSPEPQETQPKAEELIQLENMEHWAAFTTEVQPSKSSTSTPASESSTKADPAWEQFQREMKAKKEKEQQLQSEQLRREREAREENEKRRQEERKRVEQEKERKKEIAREAYMREQRRAEEIRQRRERSRERKRELRDSVNPFWEQAMAMQKFEVLLLEQQRDEHRKHEENVRRRRLTAGDPFFHTQLPQYTALSESSPLGPPGVRPGMAISPPPLWSPSPMMHAPHHHSPPVSAFTPPPPPIQPPFYSPQPPPPPTSPPRASTPPPPPPPSSPPRASTPPPPPPSTPPPTSHQQPPPPSFDAGRANGAVAAFSSPLKQPAVSSVALSGTGAEEALDEDDMNCEED